MTKPKRASLDSFLQPHAASEPEAAPKTPSASSSKTYPKINVYLTADEVRTLKLICVDTGMKLSDIGAEAIREWLDRNGHSRS